MHGLPALGGLASRTATVTVVLAITGCSTDTPRSPTPPVVPPSVGPASASAVPAEPAARAWRIVPVVGDASPDVVLTDVALQDDGRAVAIGTAGGNVAIATTVDGTTWSLDTDTPTFDFAGPVSVVAFGERFVIVGTIDETRPTAWVGDGIGAWERVMLPEAPTSLGLVTDVARLGDRLVAVGEAAWYSDDGVTWLLGDARPGIVDEGSGGGDVGCVTSLLTVDVVGDELLALSAPGCVATAEIWRSTDGAHWEGTTAEVPANVGFTTALEIGDRVVVYGRRGFLAAAWDLDRENLVQARQLQPATGRAITTVVGTRSGYLGIIDDGLWQSDDGLGWMRIPTPPGGARLLDIAWTPERGVAVGTDERGRPAIWTNPASAEARLDVGDTAVTLDLGGTWQARASLPVRGFVTAALSADGRRVFVFGAIDGDDAADSVVQMYDVDTDAWTVRRIVMPAFGTPVSATTHDGTILVVTDTAQLTAFDTATSRLVPVGPPIRNAYAVALMQLGGAVTMAVYDADAAAGALWALDDETLEWHRLTDPPGPFEDIAVADATAAVAYIRGRLWRYDARADTWSPEARSPTLRGSGALATDHRGVTWLIGGFTDGSPDRIVQAFDPALGTWLSGPDLPTPRYDPALVVLDGGDMLAIGGWTDGGPSAAVERLRP